MKKVSWSQRLRYAFDTTISRGPAGLIIWLALFSAILILAVSLGILLLGSDPDKTLPEILWDIFYQTFTPNPVDPKAGSTIFLGGMLFVTLASLLLVSIFIGILTNAIDHRIQNLRKGRSMVIEQGHTLILGWSSQIFTIISELAIANEHHKDACIVILADKDKIEMEDEIASQVPHRLTTRVVCRTGSPLDLTDLEIVNPQDARSIIILAPETPDPDTFVIKTLLALTNHPERKEKPNHIVAELHNPKNFEIAKMVGNGNVELIVDGDLISHITVQTCRQSGLSVVYTELLNFEGDEIYFAEEPALMGKIFGETLLAYEDSSVIGIQFKNGGVRLNPSMDTRINSGDKIIAISEDDDTIKLSGLTEFGIDVGAIQTVPTAAPVPERTLILGWNSWGTHILNQLDAYVAPDSEAMVVANVDGVEPQLARYCSALQNLSVHWKKDDTTDRHALDELDIPSFRHVVVLSYDGAVEPQQADAQTLITLLHLRDIRERSGKEFSIVSEMLDVRNRNLAEVTRADDFIVSDQLVSLVLAQVSENEYLNEVFADLFSPSGSEIYLKPTENYVRLGATISFYTVVEVARQRGEVAIGYRLHRDAHDAEKSYGVVVNPTKSKSVCFEKGDKVIVLAEK